MLTGRRPSAASILSTLPTSIIERVDVVTGGASAQWGSDAVAGVVNLVINKRFSGVRANVSYGDSQQQDHQSFKAELSAGFDFLGDRGHMVWAGTYTMSPNAVFGWNRSWYRPAGPVSVRLGRQDRASTVPCQRYRQCDPNQWRPDHGQPGLFRRQYNGHPGARRSVRDGWLQPRDRQLATRPSVHWAGKR